MTLDGARPDAYKVGGIQDGTTSSDEGGEHVHLTLGRGSGKRAAQVPVPHASRLAAVSHSSRPSIGRS